MNRREVVSFLGGAAVAWPVAGYAQYAGKTPTIGVLWHAGSPREEEPMFGALVQGFKDLGYIDGQNIKLVHRFPNEIPDRFRSMLTELVAMKVDVLVSVAPATYYAKDATGTIPHVFTFMPDPVGQKFVESLARPGGNTTGTAGLYGEVIRKNVQHLHLTAPGLSRIGLLINPVTAPRQYKDDFRSEAAELGLDFHIFEAPTLGDLEGAFDAMTSAGFQGLVIGGAGLFYQGRALIAKLAIEHRMSTCVWAREVFEAGALISYGPSLAAIARRTPIYVDKILKGAKPADLPVELPTKLEFLINLKTAKSIGLDVPQGAIARADDVIE